MSQARCAILLTTACMAALAIPQLSTAAPTTPGSATDVGEVIVTAQRRSENLQKVPVAISVVSANTLNETNFTGLTDLQYIVPSLQYNSYQGGGFQIRGVGTQSFNVSEEQDVAVVIDDVVQGIPETNLAPPSYQALNDIDHIEVLKGPQGTLFGKNSSAGVLNIVTKRPVFGVFSDEGSVSYGSANEFKAQDTVNIPLGDDAAARISGFNQQRDGFIHNNYTDMTIGGYTEYGFRGKLLWTPTDKLDIYAIGDFTHSQNTGNGIWTLRSCGSGFGAFSPCAVDAGFGVKASPTNLTGAWDGPIGSKSTSAGGSVHVNYKLGEDTLTAITAYYDLRENGGVDVDQTPLPVLSIDVRPTHSTQFTQEIRLSSPSGKFLEYTVGGFYYDVKTNDADTLAGTYGFEPNDATNLLGNADGTSAGAGQIRTDVQTRSYAAFGQATANITDRFSLTGGMRFTHDNVNSDIYTVAAPDVCEFDYAFGAPCHIYPLPSPKIFRSISASNVSGKVSAQYKFTPDIMVYATFAKGYKGPAVAFPPGGGSIAITPETSTDYEIGIKTQMFDHRLTFNADAFFTKYNNFQGQAYDYDSANPAASAFVTANAGGLETKGIEADLTFRATPELTLTANGAYLPTRFTDFAVQCSNTQTNPATGPNCNVPPVSPGAPNEFNAEGFPLPNAPKYTFALSANYRHVLADNYAVSANGNYNYRSSTYTVVADTNTIQSGYGLLGMNLGIGPANNKWQLSFFARNLLNQYFTGGIFETFFDDGSLTGNPHPTHGYSNIPNIESQRTFGVKFDFRFGG